MSRLHRPSCGYPSSDSESDADACGSNHHRLRVAPRSSLPPPAPAAAKKKKKSLPPQQTIDKIWKSFSRTRFSKALAVLPFAPVAAPSSPELANELLSIGYEKAAAECRRKVQKIIQECRRVNTRYRDPGFDLDWDFKMRQGNCLNGLNDAQFDLSSSNLKSPSSTVPKAVKRVHEIFEKPTFMKTIAGSDVKQGHLGDCWFMASLTALAGVQDAIKRNCVEYDTTIGIYGFVFFRDGEWIYSIVDDKLYLRSPCWDSPSMQRDLLQQIDRGDVERVYRGTYQTGSKALFFAQNIDQDETWLPLIQKAYAKAHGDFTSLIGGWVGEGLEDLSGGVTTELLASDILDTESFWNDELSRVNQEFLFGCSTGLLDGGYGDRNGIHEGHAYNILEARTLKNGTRLVKLRNPWGKIRTGNWEGAWSDGSKEWTAEVQAELGHSFGGDSVFWISYVDLLRKYLHFDRTRLFRDPEWRFCQRWIGVDVPWTAVYNEKFHIKLTKDSPLVLVLSQLDKRYFRGLQGQYQFRMHFRLHEQDRPGAEDYIVRTLGNYLMERSVSIEIPNMAAGNYSVFVSVSAERDSKAHSIEDVVKRECKKRTENEKLAQVGHAYDLAHSKAATHLEELNKIRKKTDQKEASDARKESRRRSWEKRHLTNNIRKRQAEKNAEKQRKKRQEAEEAERKKKEAAAAEEREKNEAAAAAEAKQKQDEAKKHEEEEAKKEEVKKEETKKEEVKKEEAKKEEAKKEEKTKEEKDAKEKEEEGKMKSAIDSNGGTQTEEAKVQDKAVQTDVDPPKAQGDDREIHAEIVPEHDEEQDRDGVMSVSSSGCSTPLDTPQSETPPVLSVEAGAEDRVVVPPADAGVKEAVEKADATTASANNDQPTGEIKVTTTAETNEEPTEKTGDKQAEKTEENVAGKTDKSEEKSGGNAISSPAGAIAEPQDPEAASSDPPSGTTPAPAPQPKDKPQQPPEQQQPEYSTDDSSDSPIDDWEELYSSDDLSHQPRLMVPGAPIIPPVKEDDDESDDENAPLAWNAICVVGFRVYSKDEGLELRVVMEGGSLAQDGQGEKGAEDLDNAQSNAGGARLQKPVDKPADKIDDAEDSKREDSKKEDSKKEDGKKEDGKKEESKEEESKKEESKKEERQKEETEQGDTKPEEKGAEDDLAEYQTIVQKDGEEFEKASAPIKSKDSENASGKDDTEAAETTPATDEKTDVEITVDDNSLYWG